MKKIIKGFLGPLFASFSLAALCLPAAASTEADAAIDYVVKGEVEGLDGKMLYMSDYDNNRMIDSTMVADGRFQFKGRYGRPAYVIIENEMKYCNCVLDSLVIVDFDSHQPVAGGGFTEGLLGFLSESKKFSDELYAFGGELKSHGFEQPELGEIYKHLYDKVRPKWLSLCSQTVAENPNGIGECAVMILGDVRITPEEWDEIYASMPEPLKDRERIQKLNNKYTNQKRSMPGNPFIDFEGKSLDGKDAKLSDYVGKGKYVLVDFWASSCRPCREEAERTLRPLHEKYKGDERFLILGVAVWDKHDKTVSALDKLEYPWAQIIDAGETPTELYGIDAIPHIMLIGPDGTILERDIYGDDIIHAVDSALSAGR